MTDLLELEEQMWQANREGDADFYERNLRDDALIVSKYGVIDKKTGIPVIRANHNPYTKTILSNQKVISLTDSSALVTYKCDITAQTEGGEVEFSVLATSVYVREGNQWLITLHQQTAL
jgi:ketosteroid isomerase-like protein